MPPVHGDEMDRAVLAVRDKVGEGTGQESGEFGARHLAGGHRKLAVTDLTEPTHMAVDRKIIGRVGENHFGLVALHKSSDDRRVARVAANEPVPPEPPDIACLAARWNRVWLGKPILARRARI